MGVSTITSTIQLRVETMTSTIQLRVDPITSTIQLIVDPISTAPLEVFTVGSSNHCGVHIVNQGNPNPLIAPPTPSRTPFPPSRRCETVAAAVAAPSIPVLDAPSPTSLPAAQPQPSLRRPPSLSRRMVVARPHAVVVVALHPPLGAVVVVVALPHHVMPHLPLSDPFRTLSPLSDPSSPSLPSQIQCFGGGGGRIQWKAIGSTVRAA